jgi:hypothetical protein
MPSVDELTDLTFNIKHDELKEVHQDHQRKMLVMENQESSNFNTVDKLSSQWLANHQTDTRILHPQWLKETAPGEALELLNISPRKHSAAST